MVRTKLTTQIRQEQIAWAALKIVGTEGLHGLNLGAVAKEVGIVPSAIYRHFKGRAGVVDAALVLVGKSLLGNIEVVRNLTPDPIERMRLLLVRHLDLLMEHPGITRLVFSEEVSSSPELRRTLYRTIKGYLEEVAKIIRDAQEKELIRADVDAATVSRMFLGLIQPAVILWQISDGEFDLKEHAMQAWDVLDVALMGTGSRAA